MHKLYVFCLLIAATFDCFQAKEAGNKQDGVETKTLLAPVVAAGAALAVPLTLGAGAVGFGAGRLGAGGLQPQMPMVQPGIQYFNQPPQMMYQQQMYPQNVAGMMYPPLQQGFSQQLPQQQIYYQQPQQQLYYQQQPQQHLHYQQQPQQHLHYQQQSQQAAMMYPPQQHAFYQHLPQQHVHYQQQHIPHQQHYHYEQHIPQQQHYHYEQLGTHHQQQQVPVHIHPGGQQQFPVPGVMPPGSNSQVIDIPAVTDGFGNYYYLETHPNGQSEYIQIPPELIVRALKQDNNELSKKTLDDAKKYDKKNLGFVSTAMVSIKAPALSPASVPVIAPSVAPTTPATKVSILVATK